jgi:hypothetical protein
MCPVPPDARSRERPNGADAERPRVGLPGPTVSVALSLRLTLQDAQVDEGSFRIKKLSAGAGALVKTERKVQDKAGATFSSKDCHFLLFCCVPEPVVLF